MPDPRTATTEEWDAAAHQLEGAARKFLVRQMERGLGCDPATAERLFLAYLRGALRGSDGPIHEDGRPFTGLHDA